MLGMSFSRTRPRFVREYANLRETITDAISRYAEDVRTGVFPSLGESYPLPAETAVELEAGAPAATPASDDSGDTEQ